MSKNYLGLPEAGAEKFKLQDHYKNKRANVPPFDSDAALRSAVNYGFNLNDLAATGEPAVNQLGLPPEGAGKFSLQHHIADARDGLPKLHANAKLAQAVLATGIKPEVIAEAKDSSKRKR